MIVNQLIERNIGGVRLLDIKPGNVTVFEGQNGSGKSSALKGLRSCLTKGDFGKLFESHDGEEQGEAVLIFTDGTEIRRSVYDGGSSVSVKHKGLGLLTGAKANKFLEGMLDSMSVDAEAFLYAKPKDRTRLVLEACPLELDADALAAIVGVQVADTAHPLEIIDTWHKRLYDERTDINREAKKCEATASEIVANLTPGQELSVIDANIADQEHSLLILEQARNEKLESAQLVKDRIVADATASHLRRITDKREAIQKQIDALKLELTAFVSGADQSLVTTRESASNKVEELRSQLDAEYGDRIYTIKSDIQALRSDRDQQIKDQSFRDMAERSTKEAIRFREQSQAFSDKLSQLDSFRNTMLTKLPIPGIELTDGEIIIDGKAWDQVPESRLARLAVDLAIARSGQSDIVVMDGLEKLDDHNFQELESYLQQCGRQVFVARCKDIPFQARSV